MIAPGGKEYVYFPGCSLKNAGRPYERSLQTVFRLLGLPLKELEDWNCCGATAYMSVDEPAAVLCAMRNIALAQEQEELLAPCPACMLALHKSQEYVEKYPALKERVLSALESEKHAVRRRVTIRHPLQIVVDDLGLDAIRERMVRSLEGVTIAPYYGCQIVRPHALFDDPFYPVKLDRLLQTLGAKVPPFPLKTKCCGGSLIGTMPEVGLRLNYIILKEAKKRGANLIATVCPLCQFNLECYQDRIVKRFSDDVRMPVLFFTQILGWALGADAESLALDRMLVDARPVLKEAARV